MLLASLLIMGTVAKTPRLDAVPFTQVTITDSFWAPRRETNRKVSLQHSLDMLEKSGNIEDLLLAIDGKRTGFKGPVFMDSDLYKTLEAVSYSLATDPDPALEKRIDGVISVIARAQMPDGYLNSWYQVNEPDKRLTNLAWNHELYCAGHLFEAAVAHYQATKKRSLLDVAIKFADFLAMTFGDGPGQRAGYCGHPEIELALVKLWHATGNDEYFRLARFFVEHRGEHFFAKEQKIPDGSYEGEYFQDNVPIREHKKIVGHAVRAGYLMSGVVDVMRETNDTGLSQMVDRVWRNAVGKNMYVTGGIGPSASNEGFTADYDLPNQTAYQETCASVAMVMWNHRLAMLYGDAKYADVMETALYNGVLAGYSYDGKKYFYVNPLASTGSHHRSEWFGCACCPPNEARMLASLGGYAYATSPGALWVNLYLQGTVTADGTHVEVTTNYPWDGKVTLKLRPGSPKKFALNLRKPQWCEQASLNVNGTKSPALPGENGYWTVNREWRDGDTVVLDMEMAPRRVAAHPLVRENNGKLALARGPLVYCLEQVDNSVPIANLAVPQNAVWEPGKAKGLPSSVVSLSADALAVPSARWEGGLYRPAPTPSQVKVTAVPYFAWDNRQAGPMAVWIPTTPPPPPASGLEGTAKVKMSFVNWNCQPDGIHDGIEPKSSGAPAAQAAHWWDHKGTEEWVQYEWAQDQSVSRLQVYWYDDTGHGECRLPGEWHVEAMVGGSWQRINTKYPVQIDAWCECEFDPILTRSLRLVVKMQPNWAAGVHEWRVWGPD